VGGGWKVGQQKSDRNRIDSLKRWCWRRLLGVSWRKHRTDESVSEVVVMKRIIDEKCR